MRSRLPFIVITSFLLVVGVLLHRQVIKLSLEAARSVHVIFNSVEAAFWALAGLHVLRRFRNHPSPVRRLGTAACIAFFAFGASDLVEIQTGAWYKPWWLFGWKAACVVVLLSCPWAYHRRREREPQK